MDCHGFSLAWECGHGQRAQGSPRTASSSGTRFCLSLCMYMKKTSCLFILQSPIWNFFIARTRTVSQTLLALQSSFITCHHYFLPEHLPYDQRFRVSLDKSRNAHRAGEKLTCLLTFILLSAAWFQLKKKRDQRSIGEIECWLERIIFFCHLWKFVTVSKSKFLNSKNIETEVFLFIFTSLKIHTMLWGMMLFNINKKSILFLNLSHFMSILVFFFLINARLFHFYLEFN